jgi:heterodisulfide reductase subunit B
MPMKIHYYPGCTLKQKTTALDITTREAMKRLDVELVEPEGWSCCGAEYLTEEKIVGLAAPIRILRQVRDEGGDVLVTTCSFCFAVLKRADKALRDDPLKRKRINAFLKDDIKIEPLTKERTTGFEDYAGEVKVLHLLEFLRDRICPPDPGRINGTQRLAIAPYYGCRRSGPRRRWRSTIPTPRACSRNSSRPSAVRPSIIPSSRNAAGPISRSHCPRRPRRPPTASSARPG